MSRIALSILLIASLLTSASTVLAQDLQDSPIPLPRLKRNFVLVESVDRSGVKLPGTPVATVDGNVLTQGDLLWVLIETNLSTIANVLLDQKMLEFELEREGIKVSPEELDEELAEILPRVAPGKTVDELVEAGIFTREYLMKTARTTRGWKKLVWKARNIPEDQRNAQTNAFLLQLFKRELTSRYQIMLRGRKPAPPEGAFAAVSTLIKGKVVTYEVGPLEAMQFLLGVLRPASITQGRRQLIEDYLIERELEKADATVTDSEIEAYVREMNAKYQPPFNWDMLLQAKGLSQDQERKRWRNVQAWKRATGTDVTKDDVLTFCKEHEEHFRGRYVEVKHILINTVDATTGDSLGENAEETARKKAEKIKELVEEGVEWDRLAKLYSGDKTTAERGGKLPQPVKKFGSSLDPNFRDAAYALKKEGEIVGPVKTAFGYHIIRCDKVSPPHNRPTDFTDPRYYDWIAEEYETQKMQQWIRKLRDEADIVLVPREDLMTIKDLTLEVK